MEFNNVRLVKKANLYFDGKVSSRTLYTAEGERKTLGLCLPGEYEFGTGAAEVMEMLAGEMEVLLPGQTAYETYGAGQSFSIPANSSFQCRVKEFADYCCSYAD